MIGKTNAGGGKQPQLASPTMSINSNTLQVTATASLVGLTNNTLTYGFYVNNVLKQSGVSATYSFTETFNNASVYVTTSALNCKSGTSTAQSYTSPTIADPIITIANKIATATTTSPQPNKVYHWTLDGVQQASTTDTLDLSSITTAGTYTITCYITANGCYQSQVVTKTYEPVFITFQMTVSGLGSSSPSSVTFTNDVGTFPTFEEVTIGSDIFIKIPTMYRKVNSTSSNQITSFTIADSQIDSSYQPYPCFLKEDGVTVMPYILMGKYACSSTSVANSVDASAVTLIPSAGRTLCRNKGTGYQQMDWMIFKLWQDLVICGMRTINTNSGSGIVTDVLGVCWQQGGSAVYPWEDGVNRVSGNKYVFSYKPSNYVDQATSSTTGYFQSSYTHPTSTSNLCISKLGYDTTHPFLNYPNETVNNSSFNTYYCDQFYPGTSATNPVGSRVGRAGAGSGAFCCYTNYGWTDSYGVRLCYRPL